MYYTIPIKTHVINDLFDGYNSHSNLFKNVFVTCSLVVVAMMLLLRTNHYTTNVYLHRIGKRDDEKCQCGEAKQTIEHALFECEIVTEKREMAKRMMVQYKLEWKKDRKV